jgi:lysozyme family protein
MAAKNYEESLRRVLQHEGHYSNHPNDPGGPTNFGITLADYRRYINPVATALDVRMMGINDAKKIYRTRYWDIQHCDRMPSGVDYCMFDYGVNSGVGRSQKVIQRILKVTVDGIIGAKTLAALNAQDPQFVVLAICRERMGFLRALRTWPVFGRGWFRRVNEVQDAALAMIRRDKALPPAPMVEVAVAAKIPAKRRRA